MLQKETNPRHRKARSRRRGRRRGRNPGLSLSRPLGSLTAGFKPAALRDALPVALGAIGNFMLRRQVAKMFPVTAVGWPSYVAGLSGAGLMLMVPKHGAKLFMGAVTEELLRAINQYIMPGAIALAGLADDDDGELAGLLDYDSTADGLNMDTFLQGSNREAAFVQ